MLLYFFETITEPTLTQKKQGVYLTETALQKQQKYLYTY